MPTRSPAARVRRGITGPRLPIAVLVIGVLVLAAPVAGSGAGSGSSGRPGSAPVPAAATPSTRPAHPGPSASESLVVPPDVMAPHPNPDCLNARDPIVRADELLANRYRLGSHPVVTLPADPTWAENPTGDANWLFQLHSQRYVLDLLTAARITGNAAYEDRALFLLHDWAIDNPRHGAASAWSWNDHATALRAIVLACTADVVPMTRWLHAELVLHGRTLADPAFYRNTGNHALNQAIALLEVARVLGRADWRDLAGKRINALVLDSVDAQGVTNEQSIGYEDFNYHRYRQAEDRMRAVGLTPGAAFARVDLMPAFLAQATLANGTYEQIGDTSGWPADAIAGTAAQYAATRGASGPKPTTTIARYAAGYLFARSGWGEHRPPADETFLSLKWGASPVFHGHADGLALTLAAYGSRLLVDPGAFSYGASPDRSFFKGRSAHNVVTVQGLAWKHSTVTRLLGYRATSAYVDVRLAADGYAGVSHTRRVTYSRGLDFLLIEDRLSSATTHTYRQLWHLVEDARPVTGVSSVWTQRAKGNVLIRELAGDPTLRIVSGATAPIQGWISYKAGQKLPAPVLEATQHGRSVRYLTLIVPSQGRPEATVSALRLTATGYTVTITIGGRSERVTVAGSSVWMHELG